MCQILVDFRNFLLVAYSRQKSAVTLLFEVSLQLRKYRVSNIRRSIILYLHYENWSMMWSLFELQLRSIVIKNTFGYFMQYSEEIKSINLTRLLLIGRCTVKFRSSFSQAFIFCEVSKSNTCLSGWD